MKHHPVPKGLQVADVLHSRDGWVPERARCADVAPPFSTLTRPLPRGIKLQALIKGLYTAVYRRVVTGWVAGSGWGGGRGCVRVLFSTVSLLFITHLLRLDHFAAESNFACSTRRFAAPLLYNASNDYRWEAVRLNVTDNYF